MGYSIATIRERAREAEVTCAKISAKIAELTPDEEASDLKQLLKEANGGIIKLLDIIDCLEP